MKPNIKLINKAKKLAKLSFDKDCVLKEENVKAIISEISQNSINKIYIKQILNLFLKYLLIEIKRSELTIEHAGELNLENANKILQSIERKTNKRFVLHTKKNDSLIAGLKISIDDIVIENSIYNDISSL